MSSLPRAVLPMTGWTHRRACERKRIAACARSWRKADCQLSSLPRPPEPSEFRSGAYLGPGTLSSSFLADGKLGKIMRKFLIRVVAAAIALMVAGPARPATER